MLSAMRKLALPLGSSIGRNRRLSVTIAGLCFHTFILGAQARDVQDAVLPFNQRASSSVVGLAEAYELALTNDASLKAARAQANGVAERIEQAKAALLPNISASASRSWNDLSRTQNSILGTPNTVDERYFSHSQSLQIRQPIYRPVLSLSLEQARAQLADAEAIYTREVQSLGMKVIESYLQVLLSQEGLALLDAQRKLTVQQLGAAIKRLEGGAGIRTDIDEAQARLDILDAQHLAASQARQTALLQLQLMLQQPVSGVIPLVPEELRTDSFDAMTVEDWLARALVSNPDLKALQARLDVAQLEVRKAQAGHRPTLDAVAQITRSASENVTSPQSSYTNKQVGLQLNVPLYSGGAVQSMVRQALAEQTRIEETMEAVRRDLHVKLQSEWRGVTESARRMIALEKAVRSSDQVVLSVQKSFQAGMRTVLDVLNAEQQAQQARRDLAEARFLNVASRLRLLSLTGELGLGAINRANAWFPNR